MSDELEGWHKYEDGDYNKWIGRHSWYIHSVTENSATLRLMGWDVGTRPTLRECQLLAHATARLWAGEET